MVGSVQKVILRSLRFCGWVLILCVFLNTLQVSPAAALIHQYDNPGGGILHRSQRSLKDRTGNTWQVVFFRELKPGEPATAKLRLVGFPNVVEIDHSQPLDVTTSASETFIAPDLFATGSPTPNVGQYDFANIPIPNAPNAYLKLSLPLKANASTSLKIPAYVLQEWQQIPTH